MPIFQRSAGSLALVCFGLCCLYAIGLMSRSIWFDEAITLQSLAAAPFAGVESGPLVMGELRSYLEGTTTLPALIDHYRFADVHPPLYFLIAHAATMLFGNGLFVVRAVSLALVAGSVLIFGRWLLRNEHDAPWAYIFVYGLSFAAVTTAQDARGYALAMFLGVAAWGLLADLPDKKGRQRIWGEVGLGLLCGGLLMTHYFAALLVCGIYAWHVGQGLLQRRVIAVLSPCISIAVFSVWAPTFVEHLSARPDQMSGFVGLLDWLSRAANLVGGQVVSATLPGFPTELQKLGRFAALGLMIIGAISVLVESTDSPTRRRFALIAIVVPAIGLTGFLVASIVLDRWFAVMRYFLFFAPFLTYLAARGALTAGKPLVGLMGPMVGRVPVALLILGQAAMLNFGWEVNANRGGAYFGSVAAQLREHGHESSYVIIDPGTGRGTPLAAGYALPPETPAYLLSRESGVWLDDARAIAAGLSGRENVYLLFTIERGSMESDKVLLYSPIVDAISAAGFVRDAALPHNRGDRFYAKWTKGQ